jgi:CubicO group peptidase (beta-lactamase class C family)
MFSRLPLILLLAAPCLSQDTARMEQIVQSYVANHTFMGTALVARGSQVLFSKGYGSANLEWDIPNTPTTKFRLGSVTKQFTAASILLLEERGKLSVGDPVKKYLPDAPAAWDKITIFNLLTHTSGIPNFTSFPEYEKFQLAPNTAAELVARFRDKPLDFAPGEKWSYSNSGFVLLGYLIEKITGDTYEKFVRDNIFTPLGMKESGYDSNTAMIPHRASGYTTVHGTIENAGYVHMSVPHAAGALYSTTEDLLKWELGLFGGKVLKPASLEKMTTPFKNDYAFGVGVASTGGHKVISHGGGIQGFNTQLAYYPDDKLTIVVLANLNGSAPGDIAKKLADVVHGEAVTLQSERKEITLDPKVLARYVGAYQMTGGPVNLVTLEGQQLFSKLGQQAPVALYPQSETMFFLKVVEAQVEFPKVEDDGEAGQLTLHQNGRDIVGKRMDDAAAQKAADAAAAIARRFKEQQPAPGSEAALRKLIEDTRQGKPDYGSMSEGLANATRQQLSQIQASLTQLGAIQSVTFKGVGPAGPDIYEVKFENGLLEYRIWLSADGKVESVNFRRPQ